MCVLRKFLGIAVPMSMEGPPGRRGGRALHEVHTEDGSGLRTLWAQAKQVEA